MSTMLTWVPRIARWHERIWRDLIIVENAQARGLPARLLMKFL